MNPTESKQLADVQAENLRLKNLVRETLIDHRSKDSWCYNDCDVNPCSWCLEASSILGTNPQFTPPPDSMWLVVYECRHEVIRVACSGRGFWAPGQDVMWPLSQITKWIRQILPED
jgi:hypothetical protein